MKRDAFKGAFDDLVMWSQFSYQKQLSEATVAVRSELNSAVYRYVSRFPTLGYRTLAKRLRISPAKLSGILRGFPHGRKPGRRREPRTAQYHGVMELPIVAAGSYRFGQEDVELALKALYSCVLNGKPDDVGEDSYQNLARWLKRRNCGEDLRRRVSYLVQRYETLRHNR